MGNISNWLHSAQRSIFQYFIIHRALPNTWKQKIPSRYLPSFAVLLPQTRTSDVTDYPHFSTVGHILIPAMGFPSTFILFLLYYLMGCYDHMPGSILSAW